MGRLSATKPSAARLSPGYFDRLPSAKLIEIRQSLETVLESRTRQLGLLSDSPKLVVAGTTDLVPVPITASQKSAAEGLAMVLSPTQVRTFLDCSAKWWFKYGL